MKINNLVFLLIACTLLFISCKKEEHPFDETYTIHYIPNAIPYVKVPEQHYRIFKDSATGDLDSVLITVSQLGLGYHPKSTAGAIPYAACHYDVINLVMTRFVGSTPSEWLNVSDSLEPYSYTVLASADTFALYIEDDYPMPVFQLSQTDVPSLSISVEGTNYTEVVLSDYENVHDVTSPAYRRTIFYWAKNIGIIKRTLITAGGNIKTWTLLRHN